MTLDHRNCSWTLTAEYSTTWLMDRRQLWISVALVLVATLTSFSSVDSSSYCLVAADAVPCSELTTAAASDPSIPGASSSLVIDVASHQRDAVILISGCTVVAAKVPLTVNISISDSTFNVEVEISDCDWKNVSLIFWAPIGVKKIDTRVLRSTLVTIVAVNSSALLSEWDNSPSAVILGCFLGPGGAAALVAFTLEASAIRATQWGSGWVAGMGIFPLTNADAAVKTVNITVVASSVVVTSNVVQPAVVNASGFALVGVQPPLGAWSLAVRVNASDVFIKLSDSAIEATALNRGIACAACVESTDATVSITAMGSNVTASSAIDLARAMDVVRASSAYLHITQHSRMMAKTLWKSACSVLVVLATTSVERLVESSVVECWSLEGCRALELQRSSHADNAGADNRPCLVVDSLTSNTKVVVRSSASFALAHRVVGPASGTLVVTDESLLDVAAYKDISEAMSFVNPAVNISITVRGKSIVKADSRTNICPSFLFAFHGGASNATVLIADGSQTNATTYSNAYVLYFGGEAQEVRIFVVGGSLIHTHSGDFVSAILYFAKAAAKVSVIVMDQSVLNVRQQGSHWALGHGYMIHFDASSTAITIAVDSSVRLISDKAERYPLNVISFQGDASQVDIVLNGVWIQGGSDILLFTDSKTNSVHVLCQRSIIETTSSRSVFDFYALRDSRVVLEDTVVRLFSREIIFISCRDATNVSLVMQRCAVQLVATTNNGGSATMLRLDASLRRLDVLIFDSSIDVTASSISFIGTFSDDASSDVSIRFVRSTVLLLSANYFSCTSSFIRGYSKVRGLTVELLKNTTIVATADAASVTHFDNRMLDFFNQLSDSRITVDSSYLSGLSLMTFMAGASNVSIHILDSALVFTPRGGIGLIFRVPSLMSDVSLVLHRSSIRSPPPLGANADAGASTALQIIFSSYVGQMVNVTTSICGTNVTFPVQTSSFMTVQFSNPAANPVNFKLSPRPSNGSWTVSRSIIVVNGSCLDLQSIGNVAFATAVLVRDSALQCLPPGGASAAYATSAIASRLWFINTTIWNDTIDETQRMSIYFPAAHTVFNETSDAALMLESRQECWTPPKEVTMSHSPSRISTTATFTLTNRLSLSRTVSRHSLSPETAVRVSVSTRAAATRRMTKSTTHEIVATPTNSPANPVRSVINNGTAPTIRPPVSNTSTTLIPTTTSTAPSKKEEEKSNVVSARAPTSYVNAMSTIATIFTSGIALAAPGDVLQQMRALSALGALDCLSQPKQTTNAGSIGMAPPVIMVANHSDTTTKDTTDRNDDASNGEAGATKSDNDAPKVAFPRSLVPVLVIWNSVSLGAIVSNVAAILTVAVICLIWVAWRTKSPAVAAAAETTAEGGSGELSLRRRQERWANGRFPALVFCAAFVALDGTAFSVAVTVMHSAASSSAAALSWGAVLIVVLGGLVCVGIVVFPIAIVVNSQQIVTFQPLLLSEATRKSMLDDMPHRFVARVMLHRRGDWVAADVRSAAAITSESPSATDDSQSISTTTAWVAFVPAPACSYVQCFRPIFSASRIPLTPTAAGGDPTSTTVNRSIFSLLCRHAIAVDATLTIIAAILEAWAYVHCDGDFAVVAAVAVAAVAFAYLLILSPHAYFVKAVLSGVVAGVTLIISISVFFARKAIRDGDSGAYASWRQVAEASSLVASVVGVFSSGSTIASWYVRRVLMAKIRQLEGRRGAMTMSAMAPGSENVFSVPLLAMPPPVHSPLQHHHHHPATRPLTSTSGGGIDVELTSLSAASRKGSNSGGSGSSADHRVPTAKRLNPLSAK